MAGWRRDPDQCTFCGVIGGVSDSAVVFEDEVSLAFLDNRPVFPGHCLLVPKEHHETIHDLPEQLVGHLFLNAQRLSRAVESGLGAEGTFIAINNKSARASLTSTYPSFPEGAETASEASFGPGKSIGTTSTFERSKRRYGRPSAGLRTRTKSKADAHRPRAYPSIVHF